MSVTFQDVVKFFNEASNSVKGYLNVEELQKTALTALATGAGIWGVLTAVAAHLPLIVTDPTFLKLVQEVLVEYGVKDYVAVGFSVVALVGEAYRRLNHGVTPAPTPTKK